MDLNKIASFIKAKRKEMGFTQEKLAEKLFVTEKAVSRWETGRGTPDISLLLPLAKTLNVEVSELLNGEENKISENEVLQVINYNEMVRKNKFNWKFKLVIIFYILSLLVFLFYLRLEYNPRFELNYFWRLLLIVGASLLTIISNKIYCNNYVEKLDDKKKSFKILQIILFIYYAVFLFNLVLFARYNNLNSYNLVPFYSIMEILKNGSIYTIIINILGNIFVFMPLEYFIIELFKVKKLAVNFILSFIIILVIELWQFIFKVGVFDIDDLILGIMGMMIFYRVYCKMCNRNKMKRKA